MKTLLIFPRFASFLLVWLVGCGHLVDLTPAPQDWPTLTIREHPGVINTFFSPCFSAENLIFLAPVVGCASINFKTQTCDIYYMNEWIRQEEIKHCLGGDHQHETTLADAWRMWKKSKEQEAIPREAR